MPRKTFLYCKEEGLHNDVLRYVQPIYTTLAMPSKGTSFLLSLVA